MNGQPWDILKDTDNDEKSEEPKPSVEQVLEETTLLASSSGKTPRRMSSPMKMLKKFLSTEKADDINYEVYGKLCAADISDIALLFNTDEFTLYGKADRHKRPEDVIAVLKLAALKGHLEFFKKAEHLGSSIITEVLIQELINIASSNNKNNIVEYLHSAYGNQSIHDQDASGAKKIVL